jgi:hypothetical protein
VLLRLDPAWHLTGTGSGDLFSPHELTATSGRGIFLPYDALHTTDLPILGVRGLLEHEGRFLWGLRSSGVSTYPGHWELAPSGALSTLDFRAQLTQELEEETGITQVANITPIAIIGDGRVRDLCCRIELSAPPITDRGEEYTHLLWSHEPPEGRLVPGSLHCCNLKLELIG